MDTVDIDYPDEWEGYSLGGKYGITTTGLRLYVNPEKERFTIVPINSRNDASRAVLIQVPLTYDFLRKLELALSDLREELDKYNKEKKENKDE